MYRKLRIVLLILISFSADSFAADWYISPTGSDIADGTSTSTPVATLVQAYTLMSPGDTLYFMDGTYQQQLFPPVGLSGSSGAPTKFIAVNDGSVIIAPTLSDLAAYYTTGGSLYVYSNTSRGRMSYFDFEGLFVRAVGERTGIYITSMDFADVDTQMTHHINIRRCGVVGSAVDVNLSAPTEVSNCSDILVEDHYSFGKGRKAMEVYGAIRVTVRRAVLRYDWWEGDSYLPNDPRINITCYNTQDSIFENILAIDAGPHPVIRSPDRAGLVLSGNQAGGTAIDGTSNSGYYGCIVLGNNPYAGYFNGVEMNGGTGSPATGLSLKDIAIIGAMGYGANIHDNVDGVTASNLTIIGGSLSGFRANPYPSYTISNFTLDYSVARDNTGRGFYGITPGFSSATGNSDGDIEAAYMPTIAYPPTNTPVIGHERGADVTKRYVDGVKTETALWPWPNEDTIKSHMCDEAILQDIKDTITAYDGVESAYAPGLCTSGKTLTTYIWEAMGATIPEDIYGPSTAPTVTINEASQTVSDPSFTMTGTCSAVSPNNVATVTVNGSAATVTGGTWTIELTLTEGAVVYTATVTDDQATPETGSDSITVTYTPPTPTGISTSGCVSTAITK